jgi:hypothetical protein
MLSNLSKPQVSLLPKVRWPNLATQVRKFFLSQSTQILLNLSNLTKCSQHPNTCIRKCGMPKVTTKLFYAFTIWTLGMKKQNFTHDINWFFKNSSNRNWKCKYLKLTSLDNGYRQMWLIYAKVKIRGRERRLLTKEHKAEKDS